jgi:hypothetical protein
MGIRHYATIYLVAIPWWSFGYPWILKYLDERCNRTISHKKLRGYVASATFTMAQQWSTRAYLSFIGRSLDLLTALYIESIGQCWVPIMVTTLATHVGLLATWRRRRSTLAIKMSWLKGGNGASSKWHQNPFEPKLARIHEVGGVLQISGLDDFLVGDTVG